MRRGRVVTADRPLQIIKWRTEDTIHQWLIMFHFLNRPVLWPAFRVPLLSARQKMLPGGAGAPGRPLPLSVSLLLLLRRREAAQDLWPLTPTPHLALAWPP